MIRHILEQYGIWVRTPATSVSAPANVVTRLTLCVIISTAYEVLEDDESGCEVDWWALGATLYELAIGSTCS
jgi:serine/threonine protein kinase